MWTRALLLTENAWRIVVLVVRGISHALNEELEIRRWISLSFRVHEVHRLLLHVWKPNHIGIIDFIEEHALKVILTIQLRRREPERVSVHLVGEHAYYAQIRIAWRFSSFLFAFFKFVKYQELNVILTILLIIVAVRVQFSERFLFPGRIWSSQGCLLLACPEDWEPAVLCQQELTYWQLLFSLIRLLFVFFGWSFIVFLTRI